MIHLRQGSGGQVFPEEMALVSNDTVWKLDGMLSTL